MRAEMQCSAVHAGYVERGNEEMEGWVLGVLGFSGERERGGFDRSALSFVLEGSAVHAGYVERGNEEMEGWVLGVLGFSGERERGGFDRSALSFVLEG
ncbi:hypothetical protein BVC80_1637g22 [Macleaya cordata]|uniref:Uncharacterized protein n=1 Tax=Macleaya cordata TaxID=56857 RepID=A0A200Q6S6_MACCD|nr:hypothetical protein BVC80_1637g22 [Macleaya cordata]